MVIHSSALSQTQQVFWSVNKYITSSYYIINSSSGGERGLKKETLPEVFSEASSCVLRLSDSTRVASADGKGSYAITGGELVRRQFLALFIKRFHHARRSRKGLVAQVLAAGGGAGGNSNTLRALVLTGELPVITKGGTGICMDIHSAEQPEGDRKPSLPILCLIFHSISLPLKLPPWILHKCFVVLIAFLCIVCKTHGTYNLNRKSVVFDFSFLPIIKFFIPNTCHQVPC